MCQKRARDRNFRNKRRNGQTPLQNTNCPMWKDTWLNAHMRPKRSKLLHCINVLPRLLKGKGRPCRTTRAFLGFRPEDSAGRTRRCLQVFFKAFQFITKTGLSTQHGTAEGSQFVPTAKPNIVTRFLRRVRHCVAIYGHLLLFWDQNLREKAWRSRARGAKAT